MTQALSVEVLPNDLPSLPPQVLQLGFLGGGTPFSGSRGYLRVNLLQKMLASLVSEWKPLPLHLRYETPQLLPTSAVGLLGNAPPPW